MKMNVETYQVLKSSIMEVLKSRGLTIASALKHYREAGQTDKRCRWDMLHSTGLNLYKLQHDICDSHIDTALRKITGTK